MKRMGVIWGRWPLTAFLALSTVWGIPGVAQESPGPSNTTDLSEKEKALLQKINALKAPRWRQFGSCRYDWAGWKLMTDGVRTTAVQCGPETSAASAESTPAASVAVHCDTLKLTVRTGDQPWSAWRLPYAASESKERGGEDLMVASLCANAKPTPKAQPAPPPAVKPASQPAQKIPASKP